MVDVDELVKVKESVEEELVARPGVTGVGVGYREVAGRRTKEVVIRVYVEAKRPANEVPSGALIPAEVHGHRTDVIEAPAAWHTTLPMDDRIRNPMCCGIQIGRERGVTNLPNIGTIGMYVSYWWEDSKGIHVDPRVYLLSCHHVLYPQNPPAVNSLVHQPIPSLADNRIAVCDPAKAKYGGKVDAALAYLSNPGTKYSNYIHKTNWITSDARANLADLVMKHGPITGRTTGIVDGVAITRKYEPANIWLEDQFSIEPQASKYFSSESRDFALQGDSGAVVVKYGYEAYDGREILGDPDWYGDPGKMRHAVGLVAGAGKPTGQQVTYGYANQIKNVFAALSIQMGHLGEPHEVPR